MAKSQLHVKQIRLVRITVEPSTIDCEQSLFFFRFSESSARTWEKRSRETRETRAAAQEGKKNLFSCLSHLAPSVTRVAICVSRSLLDGLQKKERLHVVYSATATLGTEGSDHCTEVTVAERLKQESV